MNFRICRQVLECGDGVREVIALALVVALKIPKLAADTATSTQSGDSEDSVAAVQDARAPIRFALGSWRRRVDIRPWIFHEPEDRASSPLRADTGNNDFLRRKGRRAPPSYAA